MNLNKPLPVAFFQSASGNEPVRAWLKSLPQKERKSIGEDIKTAQYGWPLGMPLVRKLEPDLWEIRSILGNRIARVLFTIFNKKIILLHGFIKKSQTTPSQDINLARRRKKQLERKQ